jgi:hypothetical protein
MVPSFKKGHLLAKKRASPGRGDVFAIHPKVNVILWGVFFTKLSFGH